MKLNDDQIQMPNLLICQKIIKDRWKTLWSYEVKRLLWSLMSIKDKCQTHNWMFAKDKCRLLWVYMLIKDTCETSLLLNDFQEQMQDLQSGESV